MTHSLAAVPVDQATARDRPTRRRASSDARAVPDRRSAPAGELIGEVADELLPAELWPDLRQRLLVSGC